MEQAAKTAQSAAVALDSGAQAAGSGNGNGHHHDPATDPMVLLGSIARMQEDAPPCSECGMIMVRAGACYRCDNCGATSGCG